MIASKPLTGMPAALYVGAWMRSAAPGHRGLNAHRVQLDAITGGRRALSRLRLAAARATCRAHFAYMTRSRPARSAGASSGPRSLRGRLRGRKTAEPSRPRRAG